jgi:hypothetical protein
MALFQQSYIDISQDTFFFTQASTGFLEHFWASFFNGTLSPTETSVSGGNPSLWSIQHKHLEKT